MSARPRVFVSSTIYDFRDLRSALKSWLTGLDYEPLLSEHNDFEKRLDVDSYSACLESIKSSDYFVLLIGGRRGGWFNESKGISITRAEYECAYESFKSAGRPRLITFVRASVLDVKEDRKALAKLNKGLMGAGSKVVDDPKAIFAFVDAVKRAEEMATASATGTDRPPGNWVHPFTEFSDITDVLRRQFRMKDSLRRAALIANLKNELIQNLPLLVGFVDYVRVIRPYYVDALPMRDGFSGFLGSLDDVATYRAKDLLALLIFQLTSGVGERITTRVLDEAVRSGEFLEWDRTAQTYHIGVFQRGLLRLVSEIEYLRRLGEMDDKVSRQPFMQMKDTLYRESRANRTIEVKNSVLMYAMGALERHMNVVHLICSLFAALDSDVENYQEIDLHPLPLFARGRAAKEPTTAELEAFARATASALRTQTGGAE